MELNDNWRVFKDAESIVLQYHVVKTKKSREDGSESPYEFVENWYYPNLKMALKAFVNKAVFFDDTTKVGTYQILDRLYDIEEKIDKL